MKHRITTAFLVILLLAGAGVMCYPYISYTVKAKTQTQVIGEYEEKVNAMSTEQIKEMKEEAEGFDLGDASTIAEDPFASEQDGSEENTDAEEDSENQETSESYPSYGSVLNIGEIMGYVEIPKIDIELPIYHGTGELAMQKGAGHMEGTSLPIGGDSTHCVLASHSGLTSAKLFTDLDQLAIGDRFYITVLNERHTYEVDEINVVEPDDTTKLEVIPGEDHVTLLTCTPYGSNTHRLLVRGIRTKKEHHPEVKTNAAPEERFDEHTRNLLVIGGIVIVLLAAGVIGAKSLKNDHHVRKGSKKKNERK